MKREWKPGDVAVITEYGDETPAVLVADNACEAAGHGSSGSHWHYFTRNPDGSTWTSNPSPAARPLVVIDPQDREQVERLRDLWDDAHEDQQGHRPSHSGKCARGNCLQAALREFANPTPPEPTDPRAYVTDRRENVWRLLADGDWVCTSGPDIGEYIVWSRLVAERGPVEVEGVQ